jgi:hypothetical protein
MEAKVGDHIVVESVKLETPRRKGEVLEILGDGDTTHYRVRWQDGHESTFFPGSTTHVSPVE